MNKVYLFINLKEEDVYVGDVYFDNGQYSFEYADSYLKNPNRVAIDPQIFFFNGRQFSETEFCFIRDMIPDRFGRLLINKDEEDNAKKENRLPRKLSSFDYLVGVNDLNRMGALRIKIDFDGEFVGNKSQIPPYIYLREIEQASVDLDLNKEIESNILNKLLLPGSSLGGARPKASVYFNDDVYIAKFPSKNDTYDVELLEYVALEIAKKVGINTPETRLEQYSNYGHTLLVKRFDRNGKERIHYISGVTALHTTDGTSSDFSCLDLVTFLKANSLDVKNELLELYKRVIFDFLINDIDNHLRNHAFMVEPNSIYKLSPVFDISPSLFEGFFELNPGGGYSKENIINTSLHYSIKKDDALEIYDSISKVIISELEKYANRFPESKKSITQLLNIVKKRV